MPKVTKHVALHRPDGGESVTLSPGDDLPDWVNADDLNPAIFEDDEAELTDDDGNQTEVAAGPGTTGPPDEDTDAAEARKKADRERKAKARADKKAADEEAQRVAAEREAQEKEAADKAAAEAAAAQGGNQS